ncbi:hypothetical protein VAG18_002898 [Escherichia coli]|nr:hypothetical protein [Escherichia coli]
MPGIYQIEANVKKMYNANGEEIDGNNDIFYVIANDPMSAVCKLGYIVSRWKFEGDDYLQSQKHDPVIISCEKVNLDDGKKFILRHPSSRLAYYWDLYSKDWVSDSKKATYITAFTMPDFPVEGIVEMVRS